MNVLAPKEITLIQMALESTIEDLQVTMKNPKLPFTPEARRDMEDMLKTGRTALVKIRAASGNIVRLDPFKEGDEKEFMTKES
jgi:hypothetical protein